MMQYIEVNKKLKEIYLQIQNALVTAHSVQARLRHCANGACFHILAQKK